MFIYAPEGCQHGTHINGTAYTRGTYSRLLYTHKHTNTAAAKCESSFRRCRPLGMWVLQGDQVIR